MVESMTSPDLIEEAYALAKMITTSEIFEEYQQCKYRLATNEEAQLLIKQFAKLKDQYEEVQRFGRYHPDFDTVSKEVRQLKRKLDLHDSIAAFKAAETKLEELLNEVSMIVARAVSEMIKVPTGNPYFDSMSCGGGCGSGGSCGCK
ncbi:YlbF family regulator [Anaerobacillus sp. MEB173]|uniref:YlbF family regulator n=1 Tax=Anaerobacillus sp. MEB173 TaxID=3383345 RepID=UPI003F8DA12E